MPFSIDHTGPSRLQYIFTVRRSDGRYWSCDGRWVDSPIPNVLPEKAPGRYGAMLTDTVKGDIYHVVIRPKLGVVVAESYFCDSAGRKLSPGKNARRKVEVVAGVLRIDGQPEAVDIIYQERDPADPYRIHTAIRWRPSGLLTCDCPEWLDSKGRAASRHCRHTTRLSGMDRSVLVSNPPPPMPSQGTGRAGRGIELD